MSATYSVRLAVTRTPQGPIPEKLDPQQSRVVELRYFAGLSIEETAAALHISKATANRIGSRHGPGCSAKSSADRSCEKNRYA
jgi:hypothetical protein